MVALSSGDKHWYSRDGRRRTAALGPFSSGTTVSVASLADLHANNMPQQSQFRASYTEHDAAIDRAIAETYGQGAGSALQDADGNRQGGQGANQGRPLKAASVGQFNGKREKSRGPTASRTTAPKGKSDQPKTKEKGKWIHRDKLALIEVQEYREAGLEPPQELLRRLAESRATNRDDTEALRRIQTPEPDEYEDAQEELEEDSQACERQYEQEGGIYDENGFYRSEEPYQQDDNGTGADETGTYNARQRQGSLPLKKSMSRLPVATGSPDRPGSRKRGTSSVGEAESIGYPKVRARKGSVGSQAVLDEPRTPTTPGTPGSFSKPRTLSTKTKEKDKGKGKFNTISNIPKTRATSNGRPGTAGDGRPRTATNPPEGTPPWLTGMYKPDPRLPPDQQILPTHARRLAQEQWEREGKSANTFDRDFNGISNFDDDAEALAAEKARATSISPSGGYNAPASPVKDISPNEGIEAHPDGNWPLTASRTPSPVKKRANGGGYSTIPRLTDSPKPAMGLFPSPRPGDQPAAEGGRPVTRNGNAQTNEHVGLGLETRVTGGLEDPEKGTKEKKRGGCGCCTVM